GWTYDKIGNRLTETRDGQTDTYVYLPNLAGGNSAQLAEIQLDAGGTKTYAYDAAGNQTQVVDQGDVIDWTYDDASRLTRIERASAPATSVFRYDGRSFLRSSAGRAPVTEGDPLFCDGFESGDLSAWGGGGASQCQTTATTGPTYSSEGTLQALSKSGEASLEARYVFYFGPRPVATSELRGGSFSLSSYLSVDQLGTPILATDGVASALWEGGFTPFGKDYGGTRPAAVFLRFPGQWLDSTWQESAPGSGTYYNVHRWYRNDTGSYTKPDPLLQLFRFRDYAYVATNPVNFVDRQGLLAQKIPPPHLYDPPSETTFDCVSRIRDEVRATAQFGTRYQHCIANCLITDQCPGASRLAAIVASLLKEVGDVFRCVVQRRGGNCDSAFQPADFRDNSKGRGPVFCRNPVPCDQLCKKLRNVDEPASGPFGFLAPGL
ncbi:MAG: RHS repeat-associated core domain-containing protein, partial [bacterium]|nr:RHS repeat-associated core domain-containing protein [bacterium]